MVGQVAERFGEVEVQRVPYLSRHLVSGQAHPAVLTELSRIEHEHIADGTLMATGSESSLSSHSRNARPGD